MMGSGKATSMRFYSKVTASFWLMLFSCCAWIAIGVVAVHGHSRLYPSLALVYVGLLLVSVFTQIFCYWEMRAEGLFERRLWSSRLIAFDEIVSIAPAMLGKRHRPGWLSINFSRPAPLSDRGTLLFSPARPNDFLSALRHAAPWATFDVP